MDKDADAHVIACCERYGELLCDSTDFQICLCDFLIWLVYLPNW